MRTIKLCATDSHRTTTLLAAIRRSAAELERTGAARGERGTLISKTTPGWTTAILR